MEQLNLIFKALSEPLRLRIVQVLLANGREAYGEELAKELDVPAYQLSRHLKVLKTTGLIHERKEGRWVYYSLAKHNGNNRLLGALRRLLVESEPAQPRPSPRRTPTKPVAADAEGTSATVVSA